MTFTGITQESLSLELGVDRKVLMNYLNQDRPSVSSIENQTLYYTKKIAETENWNLQDIYSDEGKSGTSLRKRDAFKDRKSVV